MVNVKIFWLFNHPAPYKTNFFNALGQRADLHVLFERASEAGRNAIFYQGKAQNFHVEIARSLHLGGYDNLTFAYRKYLRDPTYDIVVLNGWRMWTERLAIAYCKKKGIPYVFCINGGIIKEKEAKAIKRWKTKFISGASAYLAPDARSADYLAYYGAAKEKITLYPYSSIWEKDLPAALLSTEEKRERRKQFGLDAERLYVSSGQFIERKNYEELLRIWTKMPKSHALVITGEGPEKSHYERIIKENHLDNVILYPYLPHDKLFMLYRLSDGFVLLSKEDIYGHVINEALSQGLPVVARKT